MKESTKKLFNHMRLTHSICAGRIGEWDKEEDQNYNAMELIDSAYALREMIKFAEDTVKELKKIERKAHAKVGVLFLSAGATNPLQTAYCNCNVNIKMLPDVPKRHQDADRYDQFMDFFGIPDWVYQQDLLRVHWKTFEPWFNGRLKEGKPMPPGVDPSKVQQTCELGLRKRKEIEFTQ